MSPLLEIKLSHLSPDSHLVFNNQMAQRVTEDGPMKSADFMKLMIEFQHQQNERITVTLEKIVALGSQTRQENVFDFRRLHPIVFTGEEIYLDAEQRLIDTENLLVVARVPEADWVDVVKIQSSGVARSWWLA